MVICSKKKFMENGRRLISSRSRRSVMENTKNIRYFVIDLNTTQECKTLKEAMDTAEYWMDLQRDICREQDDNTLLDWLKSPVRGFDAGDAEVYEVDMNEVDLDEITDFSGKVSGRKIRDLLEPVEVFSGYEITEEIAEERGLI